MKNLSEMISVADKNFVMEYRTKGAKNKQADSVSDEKVVVNGKLQDADDFTDKKVSHKDETRNGSKGLWSVDAPTDDDVLTDTDLDDDNAFEVYQKLKGGRDFFIMGEAGWGKTSIIESIAKKCKRSIITVYLDKALATDLGGIPVPLKDEDGHTYQGVAMPGWAKVMLDNPDKQYLLFFDEMNQATPDVQNALMPIILKKEICGVRFNNYVVGAAGNYESENVGVSELSGPLKSRFGGIIIWNTNTDETWKSSFSFLHKKWDSKLRKEFVDEIEKYHELFLNPRDLDLHVFSWVFENKQNGDPMMLKAYRPDRVLKILSRITKSDDELNRSDKDSKEKLAEYISNYLITSTAATEDTQGDRRRKSSSEKQSMISGENAEILKSVIKKGYISLDGKTYGVSEESVKNLFDPEEVSAEQLEQAIKLETMSGNKFKYKKDSEWKKEHREWEAII